MPGTRIHLRLRTSYLTPADDNATPRGSLFASWAVRFVYTPSLRLENVAQAARNEESLPLRIDEGSWTCISERCLTFFHFFEKFFESVFGCSFSFFLERMRVEYLTVQRALLPDSRIILELLVEFIDMILCTPQSNTNCTNSIQAVPSSTTSLILRIFPSVKLETRFETTTGRRRRRRSVAQTSIRLFRTFSHFLSKSKRTMRNDRTKLSYETPIHRFHQTWESFRRRWFKCLNDVLGTWISISGNINDRISIKGWE